MTADPRLLFLPPLRKRAEELAQERCAYRVVALGGHPWADLPEWLRAQDIETEAHLLADLTRSASRDAVMRLVAKGLGMGLIIGASPFLLRESNGRLDWQFGGWGADVTWRFTDDATFAELLPFRATLIPGISSVTDPAEALTLIAIATLGASDAR